MGARYYNPSIGRFITRDSYKGNIYRPWTQNLYTYCNNNPVNFIDPTGHMSWEAARNSFIQGVGQVFNASNWEESWNVAATYLPAGAKTFAIEGIIGADNFSELTDDEWNSGDIKAAGLAAFNIVTLRSGGKGAGKAAQVNKIENLANDMKSWLGDGARLIKNKSGDTVIISKDGARRIRFDINNPSPHNSPHGHIEELVNGKWVKSGPIYPVDVPHN